jgi:mannitol operon transcriptional antiterminator
MKRRAPINSRQKKLLWTLLFASEPISLRKLAETAKVSVRTVQREIAAMESILRDYRLKLAKKTGAGIFLQGAEEDRALFRQEMIESDAAVVNSSEERGQGIIRDLLVTKEPIKLFALSRKYGVTDATISHDLDRVEAWFRPFGVAVIRKPGLGVYLQGSEQQLRMAASRLLHKEITVEEWLELFDRFAGNQQKSAPEQIIALVRERLKGFVQFSDLLQVEKSIREAMKSQPDMQLTDRDYVNLIVHLTLAVERVRHGDVIGNEEIKLPVSKEAKEYRLARRIVEQLEQDMQVTMPELEVGYVAMHLQGACLKPYSSMRTEDEEELLQWIDLAQSFVRMVEQHLGERVSDDEKLLEGLVTHLVPAVNRLRLGLHIHNPMLEKIEEHYPDLFLSCRKAADYLALKLGYPVPDEEVGYLAMHIGASLIRSRDQNNRRLRAVVVCASGFGTSRFLASRLQKEFPQIEIAAIVSANGLKEWMEENETVDLIISTVVLTSVLTERAVVVTPFLNQKDQEAIRSKMEQLSGGRVQMSERLSSGYMLTVARYGEAMVQILRNFVLEEGLPSKAPVLPSITEKIGASAAVTDPQRLLHDLERREKLGAFVLGRLAMIHAKTSGVKELLVSVFRMRSELDWATAEGETQPVSTVLLLAAPSAAPREHLEMISIISAELVDDWFVEAICTASFPELKKLLEEKLSLAFKDKTNQMKDLGAS